MRAVPIVNNPNPNLGDMKVINPFLAFEPSKQGVYQNNEQRESVHTQRGDQIHWAYPFRFSSDDIQFLAF